VSYDFDDPEGLFWVLGQPRWGYFNTLAYDHDRGHILGAARH
jgi:hypothetical protein